MGADVRSTKESRAGRIPPLKSEIANASCKQRAPGSQNSVAFSTSAMCADSRTGRTWLNAGPGSAFPKAKRSTNVRSSTHFCWTTKIYSKIRARPASCVSGRVKK